MTNLGLILGVLFWSTSVFAQGANQYKSTVTDVTAEYQMYESTGIVPTPTPIPNTQPTLPTLPTLPSAGAKPIPTPTSTTPGSIVVATPTPAGGVTPGGIVPGGITPGGIGGLNPTPGGIGGINPFPGGIGGTTPGTFPGPIDINNGKLGIIVSLGERIWDFILTSKPNADYQTFKTSVVPEGITSWTQLTQWSKPVVKVYRVAFTNMFGQSAGGFDYRITYFYSGTYHGKGKFIGQISVEPTNVHLKTGRQLKMRAEIEATLNMGTETDPVAAAQILVSWSTPTTTTYEMESTEFMIYGTGEIADLTNGN